MNFSHLKPNGSDRAGLAMIVASLVAISLIVTTLLWQQKATAETQIRKQGVSITRMLSGLPYAQLVPSQDPQRLLSAIFQSQNDPNFAYAAIVDTRNKPVSVASAPGMTVPPTDWPDSPGASLTDHALTTNNGEDVIEYYAPLKIDGVVTAYLRVGYFLPNMGISLGQLPFFASLALIIFLLTPLFHMLVRKEVRPLREANAKIVDLIASKQFSDIQIQSTGELVNFLDRFTSVVDFAKQRIDRLENEQEQLVTSKKLITYSKSRIESVLEAIPDAVLILDQSGNISFANQRVEQLLGVSRSAVMDSDVAEWCDDPELLDVIGRYSGQSTASFLAETVRLDMSKKKRLGLAIKAYPLFTQGDSASVHGTLIVFRDTTNESAALHQQGQFVGHVAHELKTPLNTLALCTEALLDENDSDPQSRIDAANIVSDEVERLAGLIDNLLSVTRIEMGEISVERKRIRLNDFLQDTFDVASRGKKAGQLTFELDLPSDMNSIMGDKDLLRIAINNLLTNAVKYCNPGGVVSMVCEDIEQAVRIIVRDTGIGIDPKDLEQIFDRFYRSDNSEARKRTGHGLGLALARDIVQLHHGTLSVTSTLDEGSEFVIELWKEASLLKQAI